MKGVLISVPLALMVFVLVVSCGESGADNLAMVKIPAGGFQIGCNEEVDADCDDDEYPYFTVRLSTYKIGRYEVTVGEYQKCVEAGACNNNGDEMHYGAIADGSDPIYTDCNLGVVGKENHPMNCVTWYGAKAYCEWLGQRLPTEAEWEKAARGTDGRKYPWGNEPAASCDYAVMFDNHAGGSGCGTGGTMPVGSKKAGKSLYGLYDMGGNVWEWVNDWYGENSYMTILADNPQGPVSGSCRVLRGGAWDGSYGGRLRVSDRSGDGTPGGGYGAGHIGFRCAE